MLVQSPCLRLGGDQWYENVKDRRVHFCRPRERERRQELRLDLHRPAALVVLQHRGLVRGAGAARAARPARRALGSDAERAGDSVGFAHRLGGDGLQGSVLLHFAYREAGERAQRRGPEVLRELRPDRLADVLDLRRCNVRRIERVAQALDQRRVAPVRATDDQHVVARHVVLDHARLEELIRGISAARQHPPPPPPPSPRSRSTPPASGPPGSSRSSRSSYHHGMPFCTKTTAVSRPSSGAHCSAKAPSRFAFKVTNTASCGPSSRALAVARTRPTMVRSPCSSLMPRSCIAARCAPRATTLTS